MNIQKIKKRHLVFSSTIQNEWDLNTHLILGDRFNYLIDTGLGSDYLIPVLDYLRTETKPIIVINTHYHWDHIWGNHIFKDSLIVSHTLCREMIETNWTEMLHKQQKYVAGYTEKNLPSLTFDKDLYFPEDEIRLIYTPGHTMDSISILDERDKVINTGDNIGDTMDELIPSLACNIETYRETLMKYREMDFDTCISGHNTVLDQSVIEKLLEIL